MKLRHFAVLSAAVLFTSSAFADEALFRKSGCTNCHNMDKKVLGPSIKSIAEKYKGDASAQARLEAKVRSGGKGSFGAMEMPKTGANVSDAEIKALVSWILAAK